MNLSGIDLNLLVILDAVVQEESVSRAAERVGLSQSATSHALGRLRVLLDDPLLVRTDRGMAATAKAREVGTAVHRLLKEVPRALQKTPRFDPAECRENFRLAIPDIGQVLHLPEILRRFAAEVPLATLQVPRFEGPNLAPLRAGHVDVLLAVAPDYGREFHSEPAFSFSYECIARRNHPRLSAPLTMEAFCAESHVEIRGSKGGIPDIDPILHAHGSARHVAMRVPMFLTVPWLVAESDLVATVPSFLADLAMRNFAVQRFALPFETGSTSISMLWHERTHREPAQIWLRNLVLDVARSMNGTHSGH